MAQDFSNDPRVYFAAERTFLAWIRTGLALMGFGFVVARFGLFLRELSATQTELHIRPSRFSTSVGVLLILIGVVVNITSVISHIRMIGDLKRGADTFARPSYQAIAVAVLFAIIGAAMVVYMCVMS
jgi:putative membrane protein